jgi:dienelactone hydrolase
MRSSPARVLYPFGVPHRGVPRRGFSRRASTSGQSARPGKTGRGTPLFGALNTHRALALALLVWGVADGAPPTATAPTEAGTVWREITPYFSPPPELANEFGSYRSPLIFADGRPVKTPADWRLRRQEILDQWHKVMAPWPPLIEKPRIEFLETKRRESFTQKRVRVEIAPGQTADGYLLAPDSQGPHPAVLAVFYDAETSAGLGQGKNSQWLDFAHQLTKRGFVTLSIGSPGSARSPNLGGAPCQPLSFLGYVAANGCNALANLAEVDARRIGIVGHSYGGKWAMFGSCLYEKFACAAWSDPGIVFDETRPNVNYWEPWYLGAEAGRQRKPGVPTRENPRTGAYKQLVEAGHDLHELHALMAPRPLLVSGGSEDPPERWRALNHTIAVNRLLGYADRVGMTNRKDHTPTAESNQQIYAFFEQFLKPGGEATTR